MADQESLVEQFVGVTGADSSRARFYLESAAWDLELAMSSFFEGTDHDEPEQLLAAEDVPMASDVNVAADRPDAVNKIQTFKSIHVESDSSDEEGQAYYAGGSDRSGQQILGPPKKKNADKLVDNLFKSAKEHGAEEKQDEEQLSLQAHRVAFGGAGYRLGETPEDTTVIAGASQSHAREQVYKKLKLWKSGFSIDNGPLRDYNDPENKQFLESVARGEVPQELVREARGGEVNLDMEDHRSEDYVKSKIAVKAFSGAGHMLGSPVPNVIKSAEPPAGDSSAPTLAVDETKPVTSVQLRLADGGRLVLKLNHSHTIGDIRQHIVATNPQYAHSNFCLMTTFPNKELVDETLSLEEAKLLNAVIVQKMK
ncbi:unnamed protein product [Candidula unifasciata]|uniref:Uncharacterized protein n=1 Tax=Candidula unifasciata TaxID=100452 RepID=A0A8S3Z4W4_9EUPU|nr:unnamed protein product [Candidula unifasciata]